MEVESHLAAEYVQEFVLDHLEDVVKRESSGISSRADEARTSDTNNNELDSRLIRLPSLHSNTILMPPHTSPGAHHQILTPPSHNGDEHIFASEGPPMLNHHHHHHPAMRIYQPHSPGSRQDMMAYHPGTPGTPPDTPPVSNSPDSPGPNHYVIDSQHPQPPNLHILTKAEDVGDMHWIRHQVSCPNFYFLLSSRVHFHFFISLLRFPISIHIRVVEIDDAAVSDRICADVSVTLYRVISDTQSS